LIIGLKHEVYDFEWIKVRTNGEISGIISFEGWQKRKQTTCSVLPERGFLFEKQVFIGLEI
jgi:hypothetical protein